MKNENRLRLCLKYRLRGMSRASLIYLAIFVFIDLALPVILFWLASRRIFGPDTRPAFDYGSVPVSYAFLLGTMIFLFVGAVASFQEDFNFLLALNNTRLNQYASWLVLAALSSGSFFICAVIIHWLENLVATLINRSSLALTLKALTGEYSAGQIAESLSILALALAVFLSASLAGLAAGVLSYRFGRYFSIPFWICFGTSFFIVPILIATNENVRRLAAWFIGTGRPLPSLALASHLGLVVLGLLVLSALFIRKLPQNN
jgi:hypothetical protein